MEKRAQGGRGMAPPPTAGRGARPTGRGRELRTPQPSAPAGTLPDATMATSVASLTAPPTDAPRAEPIRHTGEVAALDQPRTLTPASEPGLPPPAPVVPLGIDLSALTLTTPAIAFPRRPREGSKGREIKLQSNLFKIDLKDMFWYMYDVEILTSTESKLELATAGAKNKDRIQSRKFNQEILDTLFRRHNETLEGHWPVYDGRKTLICAKKFFDVQTFTVDMVEGKRTRQFMVHLRLTQTLDVSQLKGFYENRKFPLNPVILQAANIVIDSSLAREFVAVNRSYYARNQTIRGISGGKESRHGIYTSVVFAQWKPLLVVDRANTVFYKSGDLLEYIADFLDDREKNFTRNGLPPGKLSALSKDLKGLTIKLKHDRNGRTVKFHKLTEASADRIEFLLGKGLTTVSRYFQENCNYPLKYPRLPCVEVLRRNRGTNDFYPLEVCEIKPDQPCRKSLNSKQTMNMIQSCREKPAERIQTAIKHVETIQRTSKDVLEQHGVTISKTSIETVGRLIPSPDIRIKDTPTISVREGKWTQNEFHEAAKLNQWCVADCAGFKNLGENLARSIFKMAQRMKLESVEEPLGIMNCRGLQPTQILEKVRALRKMKDYPILAVTILGDCPIYSQLKYLSETTPDFAGIITSCVKLKTVQKRLGDSLLHNLLRKMNAKLGGINNAIAKIPRRFADESFIVIGADVNHPGVGDVLTPSIAGIVGSLDYIPSKYWTEVRVQMNEDKNRIEYIKDLEEVAAILLKKHREVTGRIPQRIYYIRDGVSAGQFEEVRLREISALRAASESLGNREYRPRMTVLIAQKRHHVRFNVMDRREGAGRDGNVPPGVYIDKDVVHPEHFDFYMYTHQGLQNTSRPTHYHVICDDEPHITADEVPEIVYYLSHCYARTSSSVSIPAPIFYAHLAAFRAKEHVKGKLALTGDDARSTSSGDDRIPIELSQYQKMCSVNRNYRQLLYYA